LLCGQELLAPADFLVFVSVIWIKDFSKMGVVIDVARLACRGTCCEVFCVKSWGSIRPPVDRPPANQRRLHSRPFSASKTLLRERIPFSKRLRSV
jgi:hypothetical protein